LAIYRIDVELIIIFDGFFKELVTNGRKTVELLGRLT